MQMNFQALITMEGRGEVMLQSMEKFLSGVHKGPETRPGTQDMFNSTESLQGSCRDLHES